MLEDDTKDENRGSFVQVVVVDVKSREEGEVLERRGEGLHSLGPEVVVVDGVETREEGEVLEGRGERLHSLGSEVVVFEEETREEGEDLFCVG